MATEGPSYFMHCLDTLLDLSIYSKLLSCHYLQLHVLGRLYSPFVLIYKILVKLCFHMQKENALLC